MKYLFAICAIALLASCAESKMASTQYPGNGNAYNANQQATQPATTKALISSDKPASDVKEVKLAPGKGRVVSFDK